MLHETTNQIGTTMRVFKTGAGYVVILSGRGTGQSTPFRSSELPFDQVGPFILNNLLGSPEKTPKKKAEAK